MKPPQSFYDFSLQFHQDLDLIYPDWADSHDGLTELYEDFRQGYGDQAVQELANFFRHLLSDPDADLEALWFKRSKAEWIIPKEGLRLIFKGFADWAASQT